MAKDFPEYVDTELVGISAIVQSLVTHLAATTPDPAAFIESVARLAEAGARGYPFGSFPEDRRAPLKEEAVWVIQEILDASRRSLPSRPDQT